jgi:hypothetical protein
MSVYHCEIDLQCTFLCPCTVFFFWFQGKKHFINYNNKLSTRQTTKKHFWCCSGVPLNFVLNTPNVLIFALIFSTRTRYPLNSMRCIAGISSPVMKDALAAYFRSAMILSYYDDYVFETYVLFQRIQNICGFLDRYQVVHRATIWS